MTCDLCGIEIAEPHWPKELPEPERRYNRCAKHWHSGYSFQTFDLTVVKPEEFQGAYIRGSIFGSETSDGRVFPEGAKGCVFDGSRFLNCDPPPGSSLIGGCTTQHYRAQTDAQDWLLNDKGEPLRPLDEDLFAANEWSKDPGNIPATARVPGVKDAVAVGEV